MELKQEPGTCFLSKGWIDAGITLLDELKKLRRRYGKQRAEPVISRMLRPYSRLVFSHMGCHGPEPYRQFAEKFGYEDKRVECCPESVDYRRWTDGADRGAAKPNRQKKLAEALKRRDFDVLCREAVAQVEAGTDILDINVTCPGVDEIALPPKAVEKVMACVDVPLCIDINHPGALQNALGVYTGKPIINSVTGEKLP